jgi:hypothetical protein
MGPSVLAKILCEQKFHKFTQKMFNYSFLLKQVFAKTGFCQNRFLPKQVFAKTGFCQNRFLPYRFLLKQVFAMCAVF